MSYSLQIAHGDLTAVSAQLGTVTDVAKLTQDLRCCLLERMGTDDMHADYGSVIDGGRMPDGTVVPGVIATSDLSRVTATVQAEISRIAQNYQAQQLTRAKTDQLTYNRVSLNPGEVLLSITNIAMQQRTDVLTVTVTLQTALGDSIAVAIPLVTT